MKRKQNSTKFSLLPDLEKLSPALLLLLQLLLKKIWVPLKMFRLSIITKFDDSAIT